MRVAAWVVCGAVAVGSGCATRQAARPTATAEDASLRADAAPRVAERKAPLEPLAATGGRRYIDPELGFEISRPDGAWELDAADHRSEEGLMIPVVMRHLDSGAQVVVQIAPAVATPTQFAERLTQGLRAQPGFVASDPEPVPLSDDAVGFDFSLADKVSGKVAVLGGKGGQVFLMMATWPKDASSAITTNVDQIFHSLRPLPVATAQRVNTAVPGVHEL